MRYITKLRTDRPPRPLRRVLFRIVPLCLLLLVTGCAEEEDGIQLESDTLATDTTAANVDTANSIYDVLQEDGRFSQFTTAIDSAGLEQTLTGPGPFTVFAPTNDAFQSAQTGIDTLLGPENRDQLRGMLLYHIASGQTMEQDLQDGASIRTLEGRDLTVSGSAGDLQIGGAQLSETNIEASNGVVHVVSRVLAPELTQDAI